MVGRRPTVMSLKSYGFGNSASWQRKTQMPPKTFVISSLKISGSV